MASGVITAKIGVEHYTNYALKNPGTMSPHAVADFVTDIPFIDKPVVVEYFSGALVQRVYTSPVYNNNFAFRVYNPMSSNLYVDKCSFFILT